MYISDKKLLRRYGMQGRSCRTTNRLLRGEDRSEARVSSVTVPIPARQRLDHENDYNK